MERLSSLQIYLLGAFQVLLEGKPVSGFDSDKTRALLAYLATEPSQAHSRDKLAGLFWPEAPERRARASLSQALHNLRAVIRDHQADPPFLIISNNTLQYNRLSDHWIDVSDFTTLLSEIEAHDHQSSENCQPCFEKLQASVALYRGDFLEGFHLPGCQAFQEWCLFRREHIRRQAITTMQMLAAVYEKQGHIDQAQETLHWLVELDPYHENAHQGLMRLFFLRGQASAALAQFESHRRTLMEDLGIEPDSETTALYERIRVAHTDHEIHQTRRHNLPEALTAFVGRRKELKQLQQQLADQDCRLLTILGAGGSGKTRLALEVAKAQLEAFNHGVYIVPLNPVQTPQSVPAAIAEALDLPVQTTGDVRKQVTDYLHSKNILLLLDGYEHLLDGVGLLAEIMKTCPEIKLLVTSRSRLNIKAEYVFPLAGMSYPESEMSLAEAQQYSAVQLFINNARRVRPDFTPAESDLKAITRICRRVQGMPLGILLASAWMATLDLGQIAAETEGDLDFLSTDWVDIPARQRNLRSTFDYSLNLLTQHDRDIFQSLCVFRGGFTRLSARQVCQATPHLLRALGEKSLIQRSGTDRYEIHELLRQYGTENLSQSPIASQSALKRHSEYFCSAIERWKEQLKDGRQVIALSEMDSEHENLRAVWNWMVEQGQLERISRSLDGLCRYYELRARYHEGESACQLALERFRQDVVTAIGLKTQAHLCVWKSRFKRLSGDHEAAQNLLDESQALLEQVSASGLDTRFVGALVDLELGSLFFSRDLQVAKRYYLRSLATFEALEDPWQVSNTMALLGFCALQRGHFDDAQRWFEKSLALAQSNGEPRSLATVKSRLGLLYLRKGDLEEGFQALEETSKLCQSIGDQGSYAAGLRSLGQAHLWLGRFSDANDLILRSLRFFEELGNHDEVALMKALLGGVKVMAGFYREAEPYLFASLSMGKENANRRIIGGSYQLLGWLEMVTGDFAQAEAYLQESITYYRKLKHLDELGWVLAALGYTTYSLGKPQLALKYLCEALRTGFKSRAYMSVCHALAPFSVLIGRNGDPARSLELYAVVCQNPTAAKSRWFEDVYGRQLRVIAEGLPAELVRAAKERGSKRDLWETAAEVLEEFDSNTLA